MSETRKLLKSARECLQRKEYQEAIDVLKTLLKEDKNSYEAYVFLGKAAYFLKEFTQAEAAYKRATALDAGNPLAWQGLAELHTETGAWDRAYEAYVTLAHLAAASPDAPTAARAAGFQRRAADAASKAGLLAEAELCWKQLLGNTQEGAARLELLCQLADVQLTAENAALQHQLAAAAGAEGGAYDVALAERLEAEWAEAGLSGGAASTLRDIVSQAPPSPAYVRFYEAYLHRLRMAARGAPVGSMERHARRADVLSFSLNAIDGERSTPGNAGGCCTAAPYEAALAMLEVEGDVVAAAAPAPGHELQLADISRVARRLAHAMPWNPAAAVHLALCIRRRAAGQQPLRCTALAGGRCIRVVADGQPGDGADGTNTDLSDSVARLPEGRCKRLSAAAKRRRLIRLLLGGLRRGACSAAGWLAASELLLEEGAGQAALDAATQGLSYLAAREVLGHEILVQADLLLKLAAGRAMACIVGVPAPGPAGYALETLAAVHAAQVAAGHPSPLPAALARRIQRMPAPPTLAAGGSEAAGLAEQAEGWLSGLLLSGRVGGGLAPFARLAGSHAAADITQQATRCLAQLALVRGDVCRSRGLYEGLVGAAALGRVDKGAVDHWAAAEYGAILTAQGEHAAALHQLESALSSLLSTGPPSQDAAPDVKAINSALVSRYNLLAGHVAWELGGELRSVRGAGAHQHLLQAAAAAESALSGFEPDSEAAGAARADAADAFGLLGVWYQECGQDAQRAARCYQRALALDPNQDMAGEALVELLLTAGDTMGARALLEDCIARSAAAATPVAGVAAPVAVWAVRCLAALQLGAGQAAEAMPALQQALRQHPGDARLWELLGAAYQHMGRHTAALRSYARALELCPGRTYCAIQRGVLQHHQGDLQAALASYISALAQQPLHPSALLGAGSVLLALGVSHAAAGAQGLAAGALEQAAGHARTLTTHHSSIQAGWKLLGDALAQHADVAPLAQQRALAQADTGEARAAALMEAARAQAQLLVGARRAYAGALHLDPTQGQVWGDAAMAVHLTAALTDSVPQLLTTGAEADSLIEPKSLQQLALRLFEGGLRLEPTSDALWAAAGEVAAAQAACAPQSEQQAPAAPPGFSTPTHASNGNTTWLGRGAAGATGRRVRSAAELQGRAEVCLIRSLQLNGSRGPAWAALARLYVQQGNRQLAEAAAERCRLVDPRLVAVWEAMAALAGASTQAVPGRSQRVPPRVVGDGGYREQIDAWEHAVGLGGGPESWLGYATGAVLAGRAGHADVLCTALKAAAQQPLLPAAHNLAGAVHEARGQYSQAVRDYQTALALLATASTASAGGKNHGVDVSVANVIDAKGNQTEETAIKLNLARALARSGQASEAVQVYRQLEAVQAVQQDATALATYGTLLLEVGGPEEAIQKLEASLALAGSRLASPPAPLPEGALPVLWQQLLSAVLALTHAYLKVGRPADAHAVVARHLAGLPPGSKRLSQLGQQLWHVLLVAAATAGGVVFDQVAVEAQAWAAGQTELDTAQLRAHVHSIQSASAAASNDPLTSFSQAAQALHACPWHPHWRLRLAQAAASLGPGRGTACLRITPAPATPAAAALDASHDSSAIHATQATARHQPLSKVLVAADAPANPPLALLTPGSLTPTCLEDGNHVGPQDPCGPELRVAAVLTVQPAGALGAQRIQQVVNQMVQVVHVAPCDPGAWYLLALVSLQLAQDTRHAHAYRKALARTRAALVHAHQALARASSPEQHACMSSMVCRLMVVVSECQLHARLPVGKQEARKAAEEALQWAQDQGTPAGMAHRQLGRVAAALGDLPAAQAAFTAAAQAGDALALVEHAQLIRILGDVGQQRQAWEDLETQVARAAGVDGRHAQESCTLLHAAHAILGGQAGAAREAVLALHKQQQDAGGITQFSSQAACHVLLSRASATLSHQGQGSGGGTEPNARQLALEAKWAASSAIKLLSSCYGPGAVTVVLPPANRQSVAPARSSTQRRASPALAVAASGLAAAEALLGKKDKAAAALDTALSASAPSPPPALLAAQSYTTQDVFAGQTTATDGAPASSPCVRAAARLVHAHPGQRGGWEKLAQAAASVTAAA